MQRLNQNKIDKILDFVISNISCKRIELLDYLVDNIQTISDVSNVDVELLEEALLSRDSKSYICLANNLLTILTRNKNLYIEYDKPLYYIGVVNEKKYVQVKECYRKLQFVLDKQPDNKKGYVYQEFVLEFMEDLGVKNKRITKSKDGGIDIAGTIEMKLFHGAMSRLMCVHGQVKCHAERVSPYYLRRLVGDELYYVYDSLQLLANNCRQLVFISHCGFTNEARQYAKGHNIWIIDSLELIEISLQLDSSKVIFSIESYYDILTSCLSE